MGHDRRRRTRTWLAVVAAAIAGSGALAAPAGPVFAGPAGLAGAHSSALAPAAEDVVFEVSVNDLTMAGQGGPPRNLIIAVRVQGAVDPALQVDLDGLHEIVQVGLVGDSPCEFVEEGMACEFADDAGGDGYELEVPVDLSPHEGSVAGESRTITWRSSAANSPAQEGSATVTVVDGIDLAVSGDGDTIEDTRPGQEAFATIFVANLGNQPSDGLRLAVTATNLVLTEYDECQYAQDGIVRSATCQLDVSLEPGEGVTVDFGFTPTDAALDEEFSFSAAPADDEASPERSGARRGDAVPLPVRQLATVPAAARAAAVGATATRTAAAPDFNPDNNAGAYVVTVVNTADLSVTGATLTGDEGDRVTARLRLTNLGPATVHDRSLEVGAAVFEFIVPEGTRVVGVPAGCFSTARWRETGHKDRVPGAAAYTCGSGQGRFAKGQALAKSFRIEITEVVENAAGRIQTSAGPDTVVPPYDDKPANNTAAVLVNPDTGGGGGGLPITGARTGPLATAGAAMVVTGGLLLLLARRPVPIPVRRRRR